MDNPSKVIDDLIRSNSDRWDELKKFDDGLRNKLEPPYLPTDEASELAIEYNQLIDRSDLNVLPLVINALVDRLQVSGFRIDAESTESDDTVSDWWQKSKMDQRHKLVMRDAAGLQDGFLLTYPNGDVPAFSVLSPLQLAYELDSNDPTLLEIAAKVDEARGRAWLYTEDAILEFKTQPDGLGNRWSFVKATEHAAGVCPVTRFPNDLDSIGRSTSELANILPIQGRMRQTVFDRLLLQRAQAWKQRWASGVKIEKDADGKPKKPFKTGADTILVNDSPDARFGEFQQADLGGLISALEDDIRAVALVSRTPPHYLPGSAISNISAEALTALEGALESRVQERRLTWGESFEHAIRVGGKMVGYEIPDSAEVIWANIELRSEAQRVDAATKLHSIGVPLKYLLERLGLTRPEIQRVMQDAEEQAQMQAKAQAAAFGADGVIESADANVDAGSSEQAG